MAWLSRQFQYGSLQVTSLWKFFFKIADTLEAETSVSGKAEYLLAIGDVAKRVTKLFEVTSIKTLTYGPKSTPFHCQLNYYPFIC